MSERTLAPLEKIKPNPWQPRTGEDPEQVEKLAVSIGKDGLLQPPAARRVNGYYELAFGHTRLAAFRWLVTNGYGDDFATMPLEVVDLSDEAMFRHAVAENLQRKDLTPIEEARAMKRAMQDFGYNSAQVGELFGKSDSTVRGTIRLLDLDPDFQAKLDAGEMTVGAARKLLAVQRVVTPEMLEKLKENDSPRTMDEIVFGEIDDTYGIGKKLLRMHSRWQKYEPTGGPDLWPLKWTYQTPPYTAPTDAQWRKAWTGEDERHGRRIKDMANEFIRSICTPAPHLSKSWEQLYAEEGERFGDVLDLLKQLMQPPACTACPFYIRQDGNHYCALKVCHENKTQRWVQSDLERMSKETGIPIYDYGQDGKTVIKLDTSYDDRNEKWWKSKHKDLRLMMKTGSYRWPFTNHHVIVAIMTGKTAEKIKEKERLERERERSAMGYWERARINAQRRSISQDAVRRFVWDQAAPVFGECFDDLGKGVRAELAGVYYNYPPKGTQAEKTPEAARIAYAVLMRAHERGLDLVPFKSQSVTPVQDAAKHLQGVAKAWGVKLPAEWLDLAAGYEPEGLAELIAAVAVETEGDQ